MTKTEAKQKMDKLHRALEAHNHRYYVEARPIISDHYEISRPCKDIVTKLSPDGAFYENLYSPRA